MIQFLIGLFLGTIAGVVAMGICTMSSIVSEEEMRMAEKKEEKKDE